MLTLDQKKEIVGSCIHYRGKYFDRVTSKEFERIIKHADGSCDPFLTKSYDPFDYKLHVVESTDEAWEKMYKAIPERLDFCPKCGKQGGEFTPTLDCCAFC